MLASLPIHRLHYLSKSRLELGLCLSRGFLRPNDLDCRRTSRPVPRLLMRTVRNSAHKNLRLNLSAVRIFPGQFLPDSRGAGLLT